MISLHASSLREEGEDFGESKRVSDAPIKENENTIHKKEMSEEAGFSYLEATKVAISFSFG